MVRRLGWQALNLKKRFSAPKRPDPEREKVRAMALDLLDKSDRVKEYFSVAPTKDVICAEEDTNKLARILTLFIYMDIVN